MGMRRNRNNISDEWKAEIETIFKEKGNLNQDDFYSLADKYGAKFGTVKAYYYKIFSKQLTPEESPINKHKPFADEWKLVVEKDMREKGRPNIATQYIMAVAEAYGANRSTVNSYFYKMAKEIQPTTVYILGDPEPEPALQANPIQYMYPIGPHPETKPEPKPEPNPVQQLTLDAAFPKGVFSPATFYQAGAVVEVKITKIGSYYAFAETNDGYHTPAMIHVKQIADERITDINQWFRFGQVLEVRIMEWHDDEQRLRVSTRTMNYKRYSWKEPNAKEIPKLAVTEIKYADNFPSENPVQADFQEKLAAIKDKIVDPNDTGSGSTPPSQTTTEPEGINLEQEWAAAKPIIESVVGNISAAAEQEMRSIMKEHTVFAFTATLFAKKEKFTPDIGLMLAQAIRQDLKPKEGL